jgi:hypothetical protein
MIQVMKHVFSIGPWLMDLINPPPRASLSALQKAWRIVLITVTLVTLCIISALVLVVGVYVVQRSGEALQGIPQLRKAAAILVTSIVVNAACVFALLQIKKLDRRVIPKPPVVIEVAKPPLSPVENSPR